MPDENFIEIVDKIIQDDVRYRAGAYEFVNGAVSFTIRKLQRESKSKRERHVSGEELIHGVAEFAVQEFGPLAWSVLEDWGLVSGAAVGDVHVSAGVDGRVVGGSADAHAFAGAEGHAGGCLPGINGCASGYNRIGNMNSL